MGELSIYNIHMYLYYFILYIYIYLLYWRNFQQAICDAIHVLFVKNPHG